MAKTVLKIILVILTLLTLFTSPVMVFSCQTSGFDWGLSIIPCPETAVSHQEVAPALTIYLSGFLLPVFVGAGMCLWQNGRFFTSLLYLPTPFAAPPTPPPPRFI